MMLFDPILLARIQFAFTIGFHIVFPAMSIGLASFLAVIEGYWLKTGNTHFKDVYKFWVKIFAVTFGMGVVSGVVMSYEFGTNWSVFSDKVANVLGPLFGFEVLTAFFLEASFLGVMLFGWGKVSNRMHFIATCIVAIGTLISAFWILAANSWMQTPQGFFIANDARLYPTSWLAIIFNPSFPYRLIHMVIAAYLSTAFIVGGVGAYYLYNGRHISQAKIMLSMATFLATLLTPIQILVGDLHGLNTLNYQPAKIAAMEGIWDNQKGAGWILFGWPKQSEEVTKYSIEIPKISSLLLTHSLNGEVKGLKAWPAADRPPMLPVFWCFRIMVALGCLMLLIGVISSVQLLKGHYNTRWLLRWWMTMMPSGFIALLSGWCVTEIGRQPYVAYGVLRTAQSVSPTILGTQVAWSLFTFVVVYSFIFTAASYYILRLISRGIPAGTDKEQFYRHGLEASIVIPAEKEGSNA